MEQIELGAGRAYLALTHPETQDVVVNAYYGMVFDLLERNEAPLDIGSLVGQIQTVYGIKSVSKGPVVKAADALQARGYVESAGTGWALTPNGKAEASRLKEDLVALWTGALEEFITEYRAIRGQIPTDEKHLVKTILREVLVKFGERFGESIGVFFDGAGGDEPHKTEFIELTKEIIRSHGGEDISEDFLDTLRRTLQDPGPTLSQAFYRMAETQAYLIAMRADPSLQAWQRKYIGDMLVYLDTNVLISLLLEENTYHDATWKALRLLASSEANIVVTARTREEFSNALNHAKDLNDELNAGKFSRKRAENEFILSYRRHRNRYGGWADFHNEIIEELQLTLDTLQVDIADLREEELEMDELPRIEGMVHVCLEGEEKSPHQVEHDAYMLFVIHQQRKEQERPLGSPWFLTLDTKLDEPDKQAQGRLRAPERPARLRPDTLMELLSPFHPVDVDFYEAFTKMAGRCLFPTWENLTLEEFYEHVEDVKGEDYRALIENYISKHHLRDQISESFDKGNSGKGMALIMKAISESPALREEEEISRITKRSADLYEENRVLKDFLGGVLGEDIANLNESQRTVIIQNMYGVVNQGDDADIKPASDKMVDEFFKSLRDLAPEKRHEVENFEEEYWDAAPDKKVGVLKGVKNWLGENSGQIQAASALISHVSMLIGLLGL